MLWGTNLEVTFSLWWISVAGISAAQIKWQHVQKFEEEAITSSANNFAL